jgi:hypothetical protein
MWPSGWSCWARLDAQVALCSNGDTARGFVRSTAVEKHELSKIDFEIIESAFKPLLQSHSDPVTADKVADLRDKFRDAYTGWLEIHNETA